MVIYCWDETLAASPARRPSHLTSLRDTFPTLASPGNASLPFEQGTPEGINAPCRPSPPRSPPMTFCFTAAAYVVAVGRSCVKLLVGEVQLPTHQPILFPLKSDPFALRMDGPKTTLVDHRGPRLTTKSESQYLPGPGPRECGPQNEN